jgi:hypothetical protein
MWTPTTRRQHSRAGLRYASDLTELSGVCWNHGCPGHAGRAAAGPGRSARSSTPSSTSCVQAVPGGCCRRAFRRGAASIAGSLGCAMAGVHPVADGVKRRPRIQPAAGEEAEIVGLVGSQRPVGVYIDIGTETQQPARCDTHHGTVGGAAIGAEDATGLRQGLAALGKEEDRSQDATPHDGSPGEH